MSGLPPKWVEYKTKEGKEYYYNTETKITQWEKPTTELKTSSLSSQSSQSQAATSRPTNPLGGAGNRMNLLSDIQKGTRLKKTVTRESPPISAKISGGGTTSKPAMDVSSSATSSDPRSGMLSAIMMGQGVLRKSASNSRSASPTIQNDDLPLEKSGSGGNSGGFADILRKNKEAAARKANTIGGSNTISTRSNSIRETTSSIKAVRQTLANCSSPNDASVEERLTEIERKLDLLLNHFNLK